MGEPVSKLSEIGGKIQRHPAFKRFFPRTLTFKERQSKKDDLESLKYVGDSTNH